VPGNFLVAADLEAYQIVLNFKTILSEPNDQEIKRRLYSDNDFVPINI
jgi:hypothetical protein